MRFPLLTIAVVTACNLASPVGLDSGNPADVDPATHDGADEAAAQDAGEGEEANLGDGGASEAGPLTFVVYQRGMTEERLCDLDGDGDLDNAIADLGSTGATMLATALTVLLQASIEATLHPERQIAHVPWVDDATRPRDSSTTMIWAKGRDDEPEDRPDVTDDFTGDERYFARGEGLDACGEPLIYVPDIAIEEGRFSGPVNAFPVEMEEGEFDLRNVTVFGEIRRLDQGFELSLAMCGGARATDLGGFVAGMDEAPELTVLELLLGGGAPFGMPSVAGMTVDLDFDGDGLERIELDSDGFVTRCIDGDLTTIEGRDCSQDARIADGFSLVPVATAVPAIFAGLEPAWEYRVEGTCDEPPDRSLWDPQ